MAVCCRNMDAAVVCNDQVAIVQNKLKHVIKSIQKENVLPTGIVCNDQLAIYLYKIIKCYSNKN